MIRHALSAVIALTLVLGGCADQVSTAPPVTEPNPNDTPTGDVPNASIQDFIDARITNSSVNLHARAIKASGVYDELSVDTYPLLLMVINKEGTLEAYIAEQGLSEEAFLNHPKLPEFVNSHLIYADIDVRNLGSTPRPENTFTSAADTEIVLLEKDSESGTLGLANGIPLNLACSEAVDPEAIGFDNETALLCNVDAPIVEDFDWDE